MLWVPPGFAHGFCVTSESADFLYKTTDYWHPEHERTLLWNDPALGIDWPVDGAPLVAAKDAAGTPLATPSSTTDRMAAILVTGAAGQLGHELVRAARAAGRGRRRRPLAARPRRRVGDRRARCVA